MYRRSFLKGVAALSSLSVWPLHAAVDAPFRRVRPTDALWPNAASWRALGESVGGRLIAVQPLFAACVVADSAGCTDLRANMRNPFYVGDQAGGTQVSGWYGAWSPAASAYAVQAHSAQDVAAAIDFARTHRLRVAVKATGHSYQGTSNAPDSLLIWTRAMNRVTVHDSFVPAGCDGTVAPCAAVTAEAGAVWIDLYHAVTTVAGRYVQGGGCTDVGVAGLIQSGGFGSMSKGFGSASASLLEAQIVTADGVIRTANACTNADLFWALKGGGGGSWGVVTSMTVRTHALPEHFGSAWGKIKATSNEAMRRLVARFVDFYATALFNPHWGEQVSFDGDTMAISMVCQGLSDNEAERVWTPFIAWVAASPQDFHIEQELGAGAGDARHWWDVAGNRAMIPDARAGAPAHRGWWKGDAAQVGALIHGYESLWMPAALLQASRRHELVDALMTASRIQKVELHFNKGLAGAPADALAAARATAINPAACDAFALAIMASGEAPAYPGQQRAPVDAQAAQRNARKVDQAAAALRAVAPDAGSYVSESNYFHPQWQQAFWGANYARLRAVKRQVDPDGLFIVHHGVGSEDWSADGFERLPARG